MLGKNLRPDFREFDNLIEKLGEQVRRQSDLLVLML